MRRVMGKIFTQWGVPRQIRADNGRPFGDPQLEGLPPLALWLIGLGIDVIWNRPRTPQQNAKVERGQRTLSNWIEFSKITTTDQLQKEVYDKAKFYFEQFRDRRQANTTYLERHPGLKHSGRAFDLVTFDEQRVADFVARGKWIRVVSKNGQVTIAGNRFNAGMKRSGQKVWLAFCAKEKVWIITTSSGEEIKRSSDQLWRDWIANIRGGTLDHAKG